jgi:hypothetical protein
MVGIKIAFFHPMAIHLTVSKKGFFSLSHLHNCVDTHVTLVRVKMPKMYLGINMSIRLKATSDFMIVSQLSHFNSKCI